MREKANEKAKDTWDRHSVVNILNGGQVAFILDHSPLNFCIGLINFSFCFNLNSTNNLHLRP